jgi:ribosomal protein S18 acetylase RimI-like enzyme
MTIDPDTVVFRQATETDLPAIVGLLADDSLGRTREEASLPLDPGYVSGFHAVASDPNQLLSVAELDGQVVGTLQITFIPGVAQRGVKRGQIEAVRVDKSLRSRGIGKRYIDWALQQCRDRKCNFVQLTMNKSRTDTFRFYERIGFKPTHEGFKLYF